MYFVSYIPHGNISLKSEVNVPSKWENYRFCETSPTNKDELQVKKSRHPLWPDSDSWKQGWGAGKFFNGSGSWLFFSSGSGSWWFFPSGSGSKGPKTPGSDRLRLLGKKSFSSQTSKVKLQKNIKQLFFLTIKLNILPKEEYNFLMLFIFSQGWGAG